MNASIRSAYERGRLRDAARDAVPLVSLFTVVLLAADGRPVQGALALAVGVTFVALRWRGVGWGQGAAVGALAGLAPLLAPFALVANGAGCAGPNCASWCAAICASGGLLGGIVIGLSSPSWRSLAAGGLVAALSGAVGCWPMGASTLIGMTSAVVAGEALGRLARRALLAE